MCRQVFRSNIQDRSDRFQPASGELVFITGGNGFGKSTFLRVLSGLYPPDSGQIRLNGQLIGDETRDKYRSLMSGLFFDYHLFHKLYGIPDPDPGGRSAVEAVPAGYKNQPDKGRSSVRSTSRAGSADALRSL